MKKIVFIDYKENPPYTINSLENESLSGTQGSVIRIAEKLGEKYEVFVLQAGMDTIMRSNNLVTYGPLNMWKMLKKAPDVVVTVRMRPDLYKSLGVFKESKQIVWHHDTPYRMNTYFYSEMEQANVTILGVSQSHRDAIKSVFSNHNLPLKNISIDYIYNPIDDNLRKDDNFVDPYKLFFCSDPLKGLRNTLKCFAYLYKKEPRFHLTIANPNHRLQLNKDLVKWISAHQNIYLAGRITHSETIQHLRESLCLFYPNFVCPEAFGLVYAEAQAIGTPVLTHDIGAASEILSHPDQLTDTTNQEEVAQKVLSWSEGNRPTVALGDEFRLSNVIKKWYQLIEN
ncbi:MAG: glycosyltransferase family 4 protein [Chlamydiota bacterium]